jgi:hypothetical protein
MRRTTDRSPSKPTGTAESSLNIDSNARTEELAHQQHLSAAGQDPRAIDYENRLHAAAREAIAQARSTAAQTHRERIAEIRRIVQTIAPEVGGPNTAALQQLNIDLRLLGEAHAKIGDGMRRNAHTLPEMRNLEIGNENERFQSEKAHIDRLTAVENEKRGGITARDRERAILDTQLEVEKLAGEIGVKTGVSGAVVLMAAAAPMAAAVEELVSCTEFAHHVVEAGEIAAMLDKIHKDQDYIERQRYELTQWGLINEANAAEVKRFYQTFDSRLAQLKKQGNEE